MAIDDIFVEDFCDFLQRGNRLTLDHRVVRTSYNFQGAEQRGAVLCFLIWVGSQMICESTKLLGEGHHEFRVAVDSINKFCQHGNKLLNTAFWSEEVRDLAETLDGVHLGIGVFTA